MGHVDTMRERNRGWHDAEDGTGGRQQLVRSEASVWRGRTHSVGGAAPVRDKGGRAEATAGGRGHLGLERQVERASCGKRVCVSVLLCVGETSFTSTCRDALNDWRPTEASHRPATGCEPMRLFSHGADGGGSGDAGCEDAGGRCSWTRMGRSV
jgi:hypothetical protein